MADMRTLRDFKKLKLRVSVNADRKLIHSG